MSERLHSFAPIIGESARILILGSMPSVQSLDKFEYYAHPRNHFWKLISIVLEEECSEIYEQKCAMLIKHKIALFDSVGSCFREGSLDTNIKEALPNDIDALLRKHETIKAVAFNGTAARKYYLKFNEVREDMDYLLLPSSSPVPRKGIVTIEDKLPFWLELRQYTTSCAGDTR